MNATELSTQAGAGRKVGPEARSDGPAKLRPPSQRILLVRLSAIGDIVFASPLIASARRAYPDAHLAWLVQPEWAPLLVHHPDLDEVIEWPLPHWRRLWEQRRVFGLIGQIAAAVRSLRARQFDLAVDLQGLLKSALPVHWSGASERIGLGSREGGQLLMTRRVGRGSDSAQISSEYRHLASSLGWPVDDFRLRVYPDDEAESAAEALITAHGLGAGYAVICPFTTRPQKHWLDARWTALVARIQNRFGLPTLMLGSPADQQAAQAIITGGKADFKAGLGAQADVEAPVGAGMQAAAGFQICTGANRSDPLVNLVGATSLLSAAALICRARLLVGVDTGLSHMGIAFERPTVLLFGSTCPYTETGHANARVLYHRRDCSPCRRRPTCDGAFDCMRDIEVDEVMATLAELDQIAGPDEPTDRGGSVDPSATLA